MRGLYSGLPTQGGYNERFIPGYTHPGRLGWEIIPSYTHPGRLGWRYKPRLYPPWEARKVVYTSLYASLVYMWGYRHPYASLTTRFTVGLLLPIQEPINLSKPVTLLTKREKKRRRKDSYCRF